MPLIEPTAVSLYLDRPLTGQQVHQNENGSFFRFFHHEVIPCTFKSSKTAGRNTFGSLSLSGIPQQNYGLSKTLEIRNCWLEIPKRFQELQKIVTDENGTALTLRLKDFPDTEAAFRREKVLPSKTAVIR